MKRLKRYSRIVLTMLWLAMSAGAVGVYAYRHFRFPSVPETFPNGELVIAIDPSYPPFGNIVEDTFVGLDIDIAKVAGPGQSISALNSGHGLDLLEDARTGSGAARSKCRKGTREARGLIRRPDRVSNRTRTIFDFAILGQKPVPRHRNTGAPLSQRACRRGK